MEIKGSCQQVLLMLMLLQSFHRGESQQLEAPPCSPNLPNMFNALICGPTSCEETLTKDSLQ